jgi:hypothetical protein
MPMRRLSLTLLFAAVLAPAALAAPRAAGDGTLAGKDIYGSVTITARGVIWGQIDSGTITVTDPDPTDTTVLAPKLSGCDFRGPGLAPGSTVCIGSIGSNGVHFQISGRYRLSIVGKGIDFSAVGVGKGTVDGADKAIDTGRYAVGDDAWQDVPYFGTAFVFPQPATTTP